MTEPNGPWQMPSLMSPEATFARAAALLDHHAAGLVHVRSAGSTPANQINPAAVAALTEVVVDMTKEFPKPLTDESTNR
jgi:protein-tyrosine-phosphatase